MSEPAVFQESITSAAIDGARIAVMTAATLATMDNGLTPEAKVMIIDSLDEASTWLMDARSVYSGRSTSVHIVSGAPSGGLIIPGA